MKTKETLQNELTAMREKLNADFDKINSQNFGGCMSIMAAQVARDYAQKLLYNLRTENINPAIVKAVVAIDLGKQNPVYAHYGLAAATLSDDVVAFARARIAVQGDDLVY